MTVKELIEHLQKCPSDFEVQTSGNGFINWITLHAESDVYGDGADKDNNYVEIG